LIPAPKPGDWLSEHSEAGQTYEAFVRVKAAKPGALRDTIYLQPLGQFSGYRGVSLDALGEDIGCHISYWVFLHWLVP